MKKSNIIAIVIGIILVAGIAVLAYLLMQSRQENKEITQLLDIEKEEMENEYSQFASQYDELQIRINNDSLYQKLENEKLKTQRLLEELRQVKATNAAEITRLKKELATVRAVMRTYIIQIDSLNRINQALTTENKAVKQKYTEAAQQITNLSEEKKTLTSKVTLAAQLDATNITLTALNKKGKGARKIKDATKLAVGFTVVKNITATTGDRTLYVRITKPGNEVLCKSSSNTFPYENRQLEYSIKKYIEYTGEEQTVTVYWDVEEYLQAGTYNVYIFADGTMIGSQVFSLE